MIDYLKYFRQIQTAFAKHGITISLPQVLGVVEELLPLFNPSISKPVIIPPAIVPPVTPVPSISPTPVVLPPKVTPYTYEQIVSFYEKYLGRQPENDTIVQEWMANSGAEVDISQSPEGIAYAKAHKTNSTWTLKGDGTETNPYIAMDPANIDAQIRASLAFFNRVDDSYWKGLCNHASNGYSDNIWRFGWNAYWESRADPTNRGSSDPSLGNLPAVHQ